MEFNKARHINRVGTQERAKNNLKFKDPKPERYHQIIIENRHLGPKGGRRHKIRKRFEPDPDYDDNLSITPTQLWELHGGEQVVFDPRLDAASALFKDFYERSGLPPEDVDEAVSRILKQRRNSVVHAAAALVIGDPYAVEVLEYPDIIAAFLDSINDDFSTNQ